MVEKKTDGSFSYRLRGFEIRFSLNFVEYKNILDVCEPGRDNYLFTWFPGCLVLTVIFFFP